LFRKQREEKKWAMRKKAHSAGKTTTQGELQAFSPDDLIFRYVIGVMGVGKKTNLLAKIFHPEFL